MLYLDWSKKKSEIKICVDLPLTWEQTYFKTLGINFSVNLEEMVQLNYNSKIREISRSIKIWSKEH